MKLKNPLISVIVPIYNSAKIIDVLIPCIQSQYFYNWELLIVDDGSTDNTQEVCRQFAQNDNRIRVICNEHQGVSVARNTGIEAARGDWITFVDADDRLLDTFLLSLYETATQDEGIDIAFGGYAIVGGNSAQMVTYKSRKYIGKGNIHDLLANSTILYRCSPWAKLFRRSIMIDNHIRFDTNLSISEDRLFFYQYILQINGVATTSIIGYLYGSFSPTSLKNKHFPMEMLSYRQKVMTEATIPIMEKFGLKGEEAYLLISHLLKIMLASMESAYLDTGFSLRTYLTQKSFLSKFLNQKLFLHLQESKQWENYLSNNKEMSYILSGRFWVYNWNLFCSDLNLRMRRMLHNLLYQKNESNYSFNNTLKIINNI